MIVAIGQEVEIPTAPVAKEAKGTAAVNGLTLATSVPGVFAGGDAVLGPASIIDAIAQGRTAATAIDRFLGATARSTGPAAHEAMRCLSCDLRAFDVEVNAAVCKDCGYCTEVCGLDVFTRSDQFNAGGYLPAVAAGAEGCIGYLNCLYRSRN